MNLHKKLLSLVLLLAMALVCFFALPTDASAATVASGNCGANLIWILDDAGTLSISGSGDMMNYPYAAATPWYNNRSDIKTVVIGNSVTSIGSWAFASCEELTSVAIPKNVTRIGNSAFESCSGLISVTISDSVSIENFAFYNCAIKKLIIAEGSKTITSEMVMCSTLTEVVIPDSVINIDYSAFNGCTSLTSITIPDSVTSIGGRAFYNCSDLSSVKLGNSVATIGDNAFENCINLMSVTIPNSVISIGDEAFSYSGLTNVTIGDGVTSIGDRAFAGCGRLTGIKIPDSVTGIGEQAFRNCSNLSNVIIGNGVATIDRYTFASCGNLSSVTIGNTVASIDEFAFYECSSLTSVTIPNSVTSIGDFAFANCSSLTSITISDRVTGVEDGFGGCKIEKLIIAEGSKTVKNEMVVARDTLIEVVIPDSVTSIGDYAFSSCSSLSSMTIGNGVTSIGDYAFYYCGSLTSITIPGSVTSIGNCAFEECRSLEKITLPDSVSAIGGFAFDGCTKLKTVVTGNGLESIGNYAFWACQALESITLPKTLTQVGCYAFDGCSQLADVFYGSTEWRREEIDIDIGNEKLTSAQWHCKSQLATPVIKGINDTNGRGKITWTAVPEADAYILYCYKGSYWETFIITELQFVDDFSNVGEVYGYQVYAINLDDDTRDSYFSNEVEIRTKCAAPALTVKASSTGKPVISWNRISGAKKYEIWRSVDGGAFKKLGTSTKLNYTDSKATAGAECTYKVKALGSKSAYNGAFSETGSCYVTCAAPSVTLKLDSKTGKPALSWKKVTGAQSYAIYRSVNGGDYELLTAVTTVSYKDTEAQMDNKYSYYVVTVGKAEVFNSVSSAVKSITLAVKAPKLTGSANAEGKPVITWTAVENAVSYEIYRSTKSSKGYSLLATVETNSYTDDSVATGKTYYYKVVAVGANTESATSSYLKLTGKCATPELFAETAESGKPCLKWYKVSGAKKYTVYRATSENGKYKKLGTTKGISYTDTKAAPGSVYFYKIVANASSSKYNSGYSNVVSCGVYCAVPTVKYSNNTAGAPVATWSKVSGAAKYKVMYMDVTDYVGSAFGPDFENDHQFVYTTKTSFTLPDTEPGRMYMVSVVAVAAKEKFSSQPSETKIVDAICATPKFTGKVGANKKPVINWNEVEGAAQYIVYRSTSKSKGYQVVGEIEEGTTFEDLTAKKGKTYYYKVVAIGYDGSESAQSAYVKVKSK